MNVVTSFILQCLEVCFKASVAAGSAFVGTSIVTASSIHWVALGDTMAGAFVVTLLLCLSTQPFGDKTTPSLFSHQYTFVPVPNPVKTVTVATPDVTVTSPAPGTVPAHEDATLIPATGANTTTP